MRGDLLIDLIYEFWTDTDELLEVKRKQISQANREYIAKWPQLKNDVQLLDVNKTYIDLLTTFIFYPHYIRYFQGIPIDYDRGTLKLISDTVRQEKPLKRHVSGLTEIEFIFAHRSCIDFLHDTISHYFQRYPPPDNIVIKWLIINRSFGAPKSWYNPVVKRFFEYRQRSLATLTMAEFEKIISSSTGTSLPAETTMLFLSDVYNIPLDPNAPTPESTWEFRKPVSEQVQDAVAQEKGYEIVELSEEIVDLTIFQSFPLYLLKKHRTIPLRIEHAQIIIAIVDPTSIEELAEIEQSNQHPLKIKLIREKDFYRVFYNLVNHFLKF